MHCEHDSTTWNEQRFLLCGVLKLVGAYASSLRVLTPQQCLPTRDNGSWSTSTRSIRDASFVLLVIVCFCLRCHGVSLFCACGLVAAWWTRLLPLRLRLRRLPLLLPPVRRRVFTQCFCQQAARQDLSAKRQLCGDVGYSAQMGGPPTVCTGSLREKTRISSPLLARMALPQQFHALSALFVCMCAVSGSCSLLAIVPLNWAPVLAKHRNHETETQHIQAIKLYEKGYLRKEPTRRHSPTMPARAYASKRICFREQTTGQPPYNSFHVQKILSSNDLKWDFPSCIALPRAGPPHTCRKRPPQTHA